MLITAKGTTVSIVVTGATGQLGRLVVEALLRRGIAPAEIVAAGRAVERLADLAERGVRVARIEFDDPDSLVKAFTGTDRLLLVSGSEVGQRVPQHRNVIEAAQAAGIGLVAYTSIVHADTSTLLLAVEHQATEEILRASAVPYVILRHSWYAELYRDQVPTALANGIILGAAGEGRVSAATRADYAEAAAAVLAGDGPVNTVYELGGDEAFTLAELAALITRLSGTTVHYRNLPLAEYEAALVGFGLPQPLAAVYADGDRGLAAGELQVDSGDLSRLIGRPTTSLESVIAAAL
jgi:NAD(P)H dehydrogenase (quinone)